MVEMVYLDAEISIEVWYYLLYRSIDSYLRSYLTPFGRQGASLCVDHPHFSSLNGMTPWRGIPIAISNDRFM